MDKTEQNHPRGQSPVSKCVNRLSANFGAFFVNIRQLWIKAAEFGVGDCPLLVSCGLFALVVVSGKKPRLVLIVFEFSAGLEQD
ncbi:hypothetical protein GCM10007895_11430 [Paraferrimonas sedimenticola]|uniref:Uncharacterized protein n=1 Tax=Paraferrimonas sedimenticola TaxID=375674 RepID=A0AA37RW52_9GAMM|nr:hypothetical protein GCM10007895_11430 [Paraferrimonas sedimenticola]